MEAKKFQQSKFVFNQTKSILCRAFAANIGIYLIPLVFIVFSIEKLLNIILKNIIFSIEKLLNIIFKNIILKNILAPTKLFREFAPVETSSI